MAKLLLVKHAPPRVDPQVPSSRWSLSDEGQARCVWLADELQTHGVRRLFSSLEPKALETAALVAARIGLVVEPVVDLHENDRTGQGFLSADELRGRIARFFERPAEVAMGSETADEAYERFAAALAKARDSAGRQDAAVITHGTVLSLFVSRHNAVPPFGLWDSLGLPSYVVLDSASFALEAAARSHPQAGS